MACLRHHLRAHRQRARLATHDSGGFRRAMRGSGSLFCKRSGSRYAKDVARERGSGRGVANYFNDE